MSVVFKIIAWLGPGGTLLLVAFLIGVLTPFHFWALFFGFVGLGVILLGVAPLGYGIWSFCIAVVCLLIAVFSESADLLQPLRELWQALN